MNCKTFSHLSLGGIKRFKDKVKFDTLDDAIEKCKVLNGKPNRTHKLVSYKCYHCHKYHIGRNGKPIQKKYF